MIDTRIVELAGDGWIDRDIFSRHFKGIVVALPLFTNIAQRVFGAATVVLVEDHHIGIIDHIDFFELASGTIIAGHDVQRKIH